MNKCYTFFFRTIHLECEIKAPSCTLAIHFTFMIFFSLTLQGILETLHSIGLSGGGGEGINVYKLRLEKEYQRGLEARVKVRVV